MAVIGCATQKCGGKFIAFCQYKSNEKYRHPITNNLVYEVGRPCSSCPQKAPFCENGLCVPTGGTCERVCKNCGVLNKKLCLCVCGPPYTGRDCSELREGKQRDSCPRCNQTTPLCLHGTPNDDCQSCRCHSGYEGYFCDYQTKQLDSGVLLILDTFIIESPHGNGYYPVDQTKWPQMLSQIQTAVVAAADCNLKLDKSDVTAAQGFPWLGSDGRLRVLLLIKRQCVVRRRRRAATEFMAQTDALRIISAANKTFSKALWDNYKTRGAEVKVAERNELFFDYTGRRGSGGSSNAGLIVGMIFLVLFLLLIIGFVLFLVYVTRYPQKFPKVAKKLPWKRKSTSAMNSTNKTSHTVSYTSKSASHSTKPNQTKTTITSRPAQGGTRHVTRT